MVNRLYTSIYILAYHKSCLALEALGNPGWNWESYQKYAKKSEKYEASLWRHAYAHPSNRFHVPEAPVPDPNFRDIYNLDSVGHDGMQRAVSRVIASKAVT